MAIGYQEGGSVAALLTAFRQTTACSEHRLEIMRCTTGALTARNIKTRAQVMQIAARDRVSLDSSTNTHSSGADPHAHTVTFN